MEIAKMAVETTNSEQVFCKRDPRRDPQPGDVLIKNGKDRQVDEIDNGIVTYVGSWCCMPDIKLASWRKWAKGAEVLHVAESKDGAA